MTRIEPLDRGPLRAALRTLDRYQWVVVTSQNAVRILSEELRGLGYDPPLPPGVRVAAVGPSTARALDERGIGQALLPGDYTADGVAASLAALPDVAALRFLYPAAERAREVIADALRARGATIDVVPIYRSVIDPDGVAELHEAARRGAELIVVTSGSAGRAVAEGLAGLRGPRPPVATMGPATTTAARDAGLEIVVEPEESSIDGLVAAIARWWRQRRHPDGA